MLGYLQRDSGPQILRKSKRRTEDTTEPKKDGKQILCFRTKTAHIEQLLFYPSGPFSQVLSHIHINTSIAEFISHRKYTYCVKMKFIAYFIKPACQREISLADVKYHLTT